MPIFTTPVIHGEFVDLALPISAREMFISRLMYCLLSWSGSCA